jgi:HD-like signal output (HDOD) protein
LGFTQAEVGATLLRHWNFPLAMSEPLRWQYTPLASGGQARMASLLLAAKWLRSAVCGDAGSHPALPDESQLQPLRLSPTSLYEMSFEVEQQMAAVSSLLSVEPEDQIGRMHFPAANFDRV